MLGEANYCSYIYGILKHIKKGYEKFKIRVRKQKYYC